MIPFIEAGHLDLAGVLHHQFNGIGAGAPAINNGNAGPGQFTLGDRDVFHAQGGDIRGGHETLTECHHPENRESYT